MNTIKTKVSNRKGWSARTFVHKGALRELKWWLDKLNNNIPTALMISDPEAVLTTDASRWGWGGVCQIRDQEEIVTHGTWSKRWHLSSSN